MLKKIFKYFSYLFIAYLFIGFLLVPLILKPQIIKIINSETYAKASMGSLSFNPLIFQLSIEKFSLNNPQNEELFAFDSLRINVNPTSLFYGAIELKELSLVRPRLFLVYSKDRTLNLQHVIREKKVKTKKNSGDNLELPHIIIEKVAMEGGTVSYSDYTKTTPFSFSLENIGFTLEDLDTEKIAQKSAGIRLYSRLGDGGFIDFKSKIKSLQPLKVDGSVAFEASKLYTEWKYLRDELNLEVADGKVSFSTHYALNLDDIKSMQIDNLNLRVEKLRIKPKDRDKDVLNLDTFSIKHATFFPLKQRGEIEKIALDGLRVKVKRNKNGKIDWVDYVKINSTATHHKTPQATPQKSKPSQDWQISLARVDLKKIAIEFNDAAINPNVQTKIERLDISADNLTLAGMKPFKYKIMMLLNQRTQCDLDGSLAYKKLNLMTQIECRDFDIVHYRPYIDTLAKQNLLKYDISLDKAFLDFQAVAQVQDKNNSIYADIKDANISLKDFALSKKSTHKRVLKFKTFTINGIAFESMKKELDINEIALNNLMTNLIRKKSGVLNIDNIVIPKKADKNNQKAKKKESPYRVKINQVALNNATFVFIDKVLHKKQIHTLDKVNIHLNKLDSKKRSWLHYSASLRLNKKGVITADGKLRHTPLKQSGTIRAKGISLVALKPYIQEKSYLSLDDGRLSFSVNESYLPSKNYPDLRMHGEMALHSLFVTNSNDSNSSLFSLSKLEVKPFTLELSPNRLYVDKIDVDSFYVSAKIDENKSLNFAKLMKNSEPSKIDKQKGKKELSKDKESKAFPVKIVKVNVKNGSAEFQDYSLPIKFKTNIHDLNGEIYAISTTPGDTTYVDIGGEVDKYGSTKLKGSVDSFNPKEYTDMDFNFKNLDLHAMSGYSASFAGYEINSGKLYLDLGYEILHSQLNATNNIMIKKIKLGKELEGENIHHLPLGFVIGLLEDSEGIVDIDMPIKGDVNSPDFKYGALVWKTLGNLIAKAVTSPFKFLGSMMGLNGEELEFVTFEFGKTNITPPQREKLDKIAKMMIKRPKINLKINGTYDEVKDLEALKRQKLVAMVMKKSGDENIKNSKTALNITMLEDVYSELRKDDKVLQLKQRLQKEYKDKNEFERAYQNSLIKLCTAIQKVDKKSLEKLAAKRAQMISSYLCLEKSISQQRVRRGELIASKENDKKVIKLKLDIVIQSKDK